MTVFRSEESRWREVFEDARRAWPSVGLGFEDFRTSALSAGAPDPPPEVHGRDLFIACACAASDPRAIGILEQHYLLPSRGSLRRIDPRPDFIDDVMQELRAKLLLGPQPRIARYAGRGPLLAWLRVAASRIAIDLVRATKQTVALDGDNPDDLGSADLGPEVQMLREAYRDAFKEALAAALHALSARDRNLLRRHLVDQLTLEEIATPYGVHPATIARRLMTLRDDIADAVRNRLASRHRAEGGATSLESLARAIRSEVYVSMTPLLITRSGDDGEPREE